VADELEQRLREALHAYADRVDPPDDGSLRAPARRPALRRWRGALLAAAAAVVVVSGSVWIVADQREGADTAASGPAEVEISESGTPPAASTPPASAADSADGVGAALAGAPVPYDLSTHCGIRGADIGGVWFAADPPLVEEYGPPAGWGDPDQRGTLTLLTPTEAVFRDEAGHEVRLVADEPARPAPCD
jgi:hypothetical protein